MFFFFFFLFPLSSDQPFTVTADVPVHAGETHCESETGLPAAEFDRKTCAEESGPARSRREWSQSRIARPHLPVVMSSTSINLISTCPNEFQELPSYEACMKMALVMGLTELRRHELIFLFKDRPLRHLDRFMLSGDDRALHSLDHRPLP